MASNTNMVTTTADPPGFRTPEMNEELEQLRQRGLAKSLNKHFTNECKKVEAELAAADFALRELETRKAKARQVEDNSTEFLQLEKMYMKVLEWKKVCRKREQETVLLYAKYCEKFGNTIKLAKPEEIFTPKKDPPATAPPESPLVTADVDTLAKAFEESVEGIPDFLRPVESSAPSSYNTQQLTEILEDASLSDCDGNDVNKAFAAAAGTPCTDATDEMGSEFDDSSIVSGLTTLNSQVTKEVLETVHKNVIDFIKSETENIRKLMLEEEDAMSKAAMSVLDSSERSSSQVEAVLEHENMVKRMQQVLDDFKKAEAETEKTLKGTEGRPIEAGNQGEQWFEHYDETFQRNYYVEATTNRTQWHKPAATTNTAEATCTSSLGDSAESSSSAETSIVVEPKVLDFDFKPDNSMRGVGGRQRSRLDVYKAKQSRRKKRQMTTVALLLVVSAAGFACFRYMAPEQMDRAIDAISSAVASYGGAIFEESETPTMKPIREAKRDVKPTKKTTEAAKPEKEPKKMKETMNNKPVSEPRKVTEEERTTPTPMKAELKTPTPVRQSASSFHSTDSTPRSSASELALLMAAFMSEAPKVAEKKEADTAHLPALVKTEAAQHWIRDVLFGHHAFKKASKMCRAPSSYCGTYRA